MTDQFREAAIAAIEGLSFTPTSEDTADAVVAALLPKFVEAAEEKIEQAFYEEDGGPWVETVTRAVESLLERPVGQEEDA